MKNSFISASHSAANTRARRPSADAAATPRRSCTPLGIVGAPHHARRLAPCDRAGAHHARLDGDVERAVAQVLAAERRRGRRQRLHLGMGRGVLQRFDQIVPPSHDAVARHDDGADRHLLSFQRLSCLVYCHAHEFFIALLLCCAVVDRSVHSPLVRGQGRAAAARCCKMVAIYDFTPCRIPGRCTRPTVGAFVAEPRLQISPPPPWRGLRTRSASVVGLWRSGGVKWNMVV